MWYFLFCICLLNFSIFSKACPRHDLPSNLWRFACWSIGVVSCLCRCCIELQYCLAFLIEDQSSICLNFCNFTSSLVKHKNGWAMIFNLMYRILFLLSLCGYLTLDIRLFVIGMLILINVFLVHLFYLSIRGCLMYRRSHATKEYQGWCSMP